MTTLDNSRTATISAPRFGATLTGIVSSFIAWNDQRATRKSLNRLTDRELDDIGLVRGDIQSL